MSSDDPVTLWIEELRDADEAAARKLWNHFVARLYELGPANPQPHERGISRVRVLLGPCRRLMPSPISAASVPFLKL